MKTQGEKMDTMRELYESSYPGAERRSRKAAARYEARAVSLTAGLVAHETWTDADGDEFVGMKFKSGRVEVWRRWDAPEELRLVLVKNPGKPITLFWAGH